MRFSCISLDEIISSLKQRVFGGFFQVKPYDVPFWKGAVIVRRLTIAICAARDENFLSKSWTIKYFNLLETFTTNQNTNTGVLLLL